MTEISERRTCVGLALAACLLALPAGADWLVTREGGRVETRGAWEVKGKLVVFRAADGTLASLRLTEVDLETSRSATEEAARQRVEAQAPSKPPEKRVSKVVLTDKDFRKAASAVQPANSENAATAAPAAETAAQPLGLGVANWDRGREESDGSVVITGTLQNSAISTATDIGLAVQLLDEAGKVMATGQAELSATALPPGQQTGFRVAFPGIFAFADAKFETRSVNLVTRPGGTSQPAAGGGS
jgi:hypothetical protein